MSNPRLHFEKFLLGGISLLALACASPVLADTSTSSDQSVKPDENVVVIVKGTRASIQSAANLKRRAQIVQDSIVAEDIGKFPDTNIAESLSRVTGVQISRDIGGEGRFVSIRGLGSQYNLATLNGRVLATDNAGRDFSFDIVPAEAVAAATVYKSSMASLPEGSTGGQVELQTLNPLARKGFHLAGQVGGYYDDVTKETTPHMSAFISNTFDQDRLGAYVGVTYYKRDWRSDVFEELQTSTEATDAQGHGMFEPDYSGQDGRAAFPGISSFQIKYGTRERTGVVAGVSYRPSDQLEFKLDTFFSDYKDNDLSYSYNQNFYTNYGWSHFRGTLVPWAGLGDNKYLLTSFDIPNIPLEEGTDTHHRETKTYMVAGHTKWHATDKLTVDWDLALSGSNKPDAGLDAYTVIGLANADGNGTNGGNYHFAWTGTAPNVVCTTASGELCLTQPLSSFGLHFMEQKGESDKDDVKSTKLDFTYKFATQIESSLQWGVFYSDREKDKKLYDSPNGCAYCGFYETFGSIGTPVGVAFPKGGFLASDIGTPGNAWYAVTSDQVFAAAIAANGQDSFDTNIKAQFLPRASSNILEEIYGGYAQANLRSEHVDTNFGVRWVHTGDTSRGATQQILSITPVANSTNYTATYSDVVPVSIKNDYNELLPSANVTYHFAPNLQLRFAASKTMRRPSFSDLGPDVTWEVNSPPPRLTRNGNPMLRPEKSNNLDLSLEWYGHNGNSLSAAFYEKHLTDYITTGTTQETILGQVFQVGEKLNGDKAQVSGLEIAYQHLWDNGFGIQANYTHADSKAFVTVGDVVHESGLDGVSKNTYNLTGLYEKNGFSARISYNYRSAYTACGTCAPNGAGPTTTDATGFLDASINYDVNKTYTVYFDASNLTKEVGHTWAIDPRYTTYYEPYASRFEFGVRAKWW